MKQNSSTEKSKNRGFTLVELIVVIAILAILSAVGAVAYTGYIEHTKKGLDKQTVGEIMRAIELADYSDPTLFGENGGAMIALTNKGVQAAGGLEGSDIEGALKDAFGDLTSTKLSYDKWSGTPDMGVFSELGKTGSKINSYLETTKGGGAASFANEIDQIWEAVGKYKAMYANGLGRVVQDTETYQDTIEEYWSGSGVTTGTGLFQEAAGIDTTVAQAAEIARTYAFISYAEKQTGLTEDMKKQLADEKAKIIDPRNGMPGAYFAIFNNSDWNSIISSYKNDGQAKIDAEAYLGLLEAAKAVKTTDMDDDALLNKMSDYVGMVGNVLTRATDLSAIQALAGEIGNNPAVVVNVTKSAGKLAISVSPKDADPRNGSEEGGGSSFNPADYTATLTFDSSGKTYVGPIVLSMSDPSYQKCTIVDPDAGEYVLVSSVTPSNSGVVTAGSNGSSWEVSAVGAGETDITITWDYDGEDQTSCTVHVIVY